MYDMGQRIELCLVHSRPSWKAMTGYISLVMSSAPMQVVLMCKGPLSGLRVDSAFNQCNSSCNVPTTVCYEHAVGEGLV